MAGCSSYGRHERDGRRHQQRSGDAPHDCCVYGVFTTLTPSTTGHEPQSSPKDKVRHNFELEPLINPRILVAEDAESQCRARIKLSLRKTGLALAYRGARRQLLVNDKRRPQRSPR